jgi:hypothetical protein
MTYHSFKSLIVHTNLERIRKGLMQKAISSSYFDRLIAVSHSYSTEEIQLTVKAKMWVDSYEYRSHFLIEDDY